MRVFEASDIVEIAIRIEENGANFYKFAEQLAKQEEAKILFAQLAVEEFIIKKHSKAFLPKWKKIIRRKVTMANTAPIFVITWTII
jgi:rubrerythrin